MTSPQHTLHSMCPQCPHIMLGKDSCFISAWVFCGAKITCKNVMLTVKTAHKNPTWVDIWESEFYSQILKVTSFGCLGSATWFFHSRVDSTAVTH
jgi:hypothetical protein